MRLYISIFCFFFLIPFLINAQTRQENDILTGIWTSRGKNKTTQIEFYVQNGKYFAKVISIKDNNPIDQNDPEKQLKNRKFIDFSMIRNLSFSKGKYINGEFHIPDKGKMANCTIEWKDQNTLFIIGSKAFISRKTEWKR